MDKILNKSHIRIKEKAADWEEAIRKAGAVLVEAGSIRPAYVEKMIQSVRELGPYIVIMPGFALAHAAPCEEVLKSDVALITLESPVEFGSPNDPVSVVLCLGCTDSTSHLDTLSGIAETLLAEEKMARRKCSGLCPGKQMCLPEYEKRLRKEEKSMGMIKIQAVCGFGCGSSLFLKMKIQEVLKENDLEAEIFCGDVGTCTSTPCDVIFTSEELAARVAERSTVPVVTICNFVNKKEVTEKTLEFFRSLEK